MFKQKRKRFPCEEEELTLFEILLTLILFVIMLIGFLSLVNYLDDRDKAIMEGAKKYEECIEYQYNGMHPVEVYQLNNGTWPECDYEKIKTN